MNIRVRRHWASHLAPVPTPRTVERPVGPGIEPLPVEAAADDMLSVTTPFEDWCEAHDLHPEALGAWETFAFERVRGA